MNKLHVFTGCMRGMYGPNCKMKCNCFNRSCNPFTGECITDDDSSGCSPGWTGKNCQNECPEYTYGTDCKEECGMCMEGNSCDRVTGECPIPTAGQEEPGFEGSGDLNDNNEDNSTETTEYVCSFGYQPPLCKESCSKGTWYQDCELNCHCRDDYDCDKTIGKCPDIAGYNKNQLCARGWQGEACNYTCDSGLYGIDCAQPCGMCVRNATCNHVMGMCDEPGSRGELCQDGYVPAKCVELCSLGKFGFNCSMDCNCANGTYCHPALGNCSGYCASGYSGFK